MLFSSLERLQDQLNILDGHDILYILSNVQYLLSPNPLSFGCHNITLTYHLSGQCLRSQGWLSAKSKKMPFITLVMFRSETGWNNKLTVQLSLRWKKKITSGHYPHSNDRDLFTEQVSFKHAGLKLLLITKFKARRWKWYSGCISRAPGLTKSYVSLSIRPARKFRKWLWGYRHTVASKGQTEAH